MQSSKVLLAGIGRGPFEAIAPVLERQKLEIVRVESPEAAVEMARSERVALIIFDAEPNEMPLEEVVARLRDEDSVEVTEGVAAGDLLVVVGQDGLADGTPIEVLGEAPAPMRQASAGESDGPSPETLEAMRERMKERGLSDEEIETRIQQIQAGEAPRRGPGQGPGQGGRMGGGMGQGGGGEIPPFMAQRIKEASPEELEQIKERMKQFGMSDERIEEIVTQIRSEGGGS